MQDRIAAAMQNEACRQDLLGPCWQPHPEHPHDDRICLERLKFMKTDLAHLMLADAVMRRLG